MRLHGAGRANASRDGSLAPSTKERGGALVETAILLPLLMLLVFGIWTSARAWNVHTTLDHAAREAARRGAVTAVHSEILTVAEGEVSAAAIPWSDVVACSAIIRDGAVDRPDSITDPCIPLGSADGQDPTTDDRVQVRLEIPDYRLEFLFFETSVTLRAQAVARLERGA